MQTFPCVDYPCYVPAVDPSNCALGWYVVRYANGSAGIACLPSINPNVVEILGDRHRSRTAALVEAVDLNLKETIADIRNA
jgi:hypothetical protein